MYAEVISEQILSLVPEKNNASNALSLLCNIV